MQQNLTSALLQMASPKWNRWDGVLWLRLGEYQLELLSRDYGPLEPGNAEACEHVREAYPELAMLSDGAVYGLWSDYCDDRLIYVGFVEAYRTADFVHYVLSRRLERGLPRRRGAASIFAGEQLAAALNAPEGYSRAAIAESLQQALVSARSA